MKKTIMILIVLALLVPYTMSAETVNGAAAKTQPQKTNYEELRVGSAMPLTGKFMGSLWTNNGGDVDISEMLHGYNLVEWDTAFSGYRLDPSVISGSVVTANEAGDHIYNLFLYDDLYYSDGTPITAWDYAFSMLLRIAPQMVELGGNPVKADYLVGYQDYISGRTPYLAGMRVLDDHQLVITLNHEYLPFFFEIALLDCRPYPMSVIMPNGRIADDGNGVYLSTEWNIAELKGTLLDEKTGYVSHPSVVSGPYRMVSFDGTEAVFEKNPYYKGNSMGAKPLIERVVCKTANREAIVEGLLSGEYDLQNKVTNAAVIAEGLTKLVQGGEFAVAPYQRSGLSFISFNTEKAAVSSAAVRKAIAHCLDKDGLTADYVGSFGLRVDGYYGLGQWMYQVLSGTAPYSEEESEEAWKKLSEAMEALPVYEQDIEAAIALLEGDGWTLNRAGGSFNREADDVRCKRIDGELVALDLKLLHASSVPIGEYLENRLAKPLAEAGIHLTVESTDDPLSAYYGSGTEAWDMVYMATNFDVNFDPTETFEPGNSKNHTHINDEELYKLAQEMRRTEPGKLYEYCQKWLAFQERFIEVEPMIPVYSNVYFDFYNRALHQYDISENFTWSRAIVSAYLGDYGDEEVPQE